MFLLLLLSLLSKDSTGFQHASTVRPRLSMARAAEEATTADRAAALEAMRFCYSSPTAVVATVWPTAHSEAPAARSWLVDNGARIVYEREVMVDYRGAVPTCMALYYGEDWLDSNCWYMESPLPEGPPKGPHAGAKWKAALTFPSNTPPMTVIVADAADAGGSLWRTKYSIREALRSKVGGLGNCCLHITDDQTTALPAATEGGRGGGRGGFACDSSYAFHCARVLLDDGSVAFLNAADPAAENYGENFARYASWLASEPGSSQAPGWEV